MADQLRAIAGCVDVTPEHPCPLQGYVTRTAPFSAVADPLEINAVCFVQGNRTAVLYSADVLFLDGAMVAQIEQMIRSLVPGVELQVIGVATHTHCAPAVDSSKPAFGKTDSRYVSTFVDRLTGLLRRLLTNAPIPAELTLHQGRVNHSINRRRRGWSISRQKLLRRKMIIAPNPDGPTDELVRLLVIEDAMGRAVCVVWNYACHPAMFPLLDHVSADFPGVVRSAIRQRFADPRLPVVYLQGFSGDVLPTMLGRVHGMRARLLRLLNGQIFADIPLEEFQAWSASLASDVCRLMDGPPRTLVPELRFAEVRAPLAEIIDGAAKDRELRFQRLTIAPDLHLVGMSAEVVAEYSQPLQDMLAPNQVIPVGCLGDCYGYLPSEPMLAEGGYEVEGFFPYFSLSGRFRSTVQQTVIENLDQLLKA